ncbi:MAG: acetylglutamate kinase [Balneolaceae bacterium]
MKSIKVIKIGGKVAENDEHLDAFLKDFVALNGAKILVHGGGIVATKIGEKLGIETTMIEGRRVTDKETLEVATMVYGGLINKKIVGRLQALGVNAAGFTGADMNLIQSKKRNPEPIDFGWVGDIEFVNLHGLKSLLGQEITPILAPLTHDGKGHLLNTNADSIASKVAQELAKEFEVELKLCFDMAGVLNEEKLITEMNLLLFRYLEGNGIIKDGMIPKLDLGFEALNNGVKEVTIQSFKSLKESNSGTRLSK